MQKMLHKMANAIVSSNMWKKFTTPTVRWGITAFLRDPAKQQRLGICYDYDGEVTGDDGTIYHTYQMQCNTGNDIPSTIKNWRDANGNTHAMMANVMVKKDGTGPRKMWRML